MLIFHEGLPGSGKSYESLVEHIIPSIKKGRKVFARINGLNYEKISELADKTKEEVEQLLFHITEEQVFEIHEHVQNDSMVLIDELQNFFPSGRGKLSEGITKFVTEHRHRGIDIVAMGQSITDVHNLWRRRTQRKLQFLKLDMVGKANSYKWTAFQGRQDAKGEVLFEKIKSGTKKYDTKYFGSYASHQSSTENTENLEDDRLNIFKTKSFTFYLPIFVGVFVFALYYLTTFFSEPPVNENSGQIANENVEQKQQYTPPHSTAVKTEKDAEPEFKNEIGFNFVQENDNTYDSKITYLDERNNIVWDMIVVWYDRSGKVMDRVTGVDLRSMGYKVTYKGYGVVVEKDDYKALYRFKPRHEPPQSIPDDTRETLHTI